MLRTGVGTHKSGAGGGLPTKARPKSLAGAETEAHGAEQAAPHTVPMPEQPSRAIANGTATSDRSTIRAITQHRISPAVSQSRAGGATLANGARTDGTCVPPNRRVSIPLTDGFLAGRIIA